MGIFLVSVTVGNLLTGAINLYIQIPSIEFKKEPIHFGYDGKSGTLDDSYAHLSKNKDSYWQKYGESMLKLIEWLRALPDNRKVYGLTSHRRLCLLAENRANSPW